MQNFKNSSTVSSTTTVSHYISDYIIVTQVNQKNMLPKYVHLIDCNLGVQRRIYEL